MNDRMEELTLSDLEIIEPVVATPEEPKELIIIDQLPIIRQNLEIMSAEIKKETADALALICTEETVKTVKKVRTKLTGKFNDLDAQRIDIKNKILAPYEALNTVFKELITDPYKESDNQLKEKVNSVESELKSKMEKEVMRYFAELTAAESIDFVTFEQVGLNVILSATVPALKKQTKTFIDRVVGDIALIDTQEFKPEILVEYKRTLNVSKSITDVVARHKAVEEEKARQIEREAARTAQNARVAQVNTFLPPPVQAPVSAPQRATEPLQTASASPVKEFNVVFKVYGTIDQLKAMKAYLVSNNLRYENVSAPPVTPQVTPEVTPQVEQPKAPEQKSAKVMPVAFVQFQKNGEFVGREYSYVIPQQLISEVVAGSLVDVATRNGIGSAMVTRIGTTADIEASIIPRLLLIEGMSEKKEEEI